MKIFLMTAVKDAIKTARTKNLLTDDGDLTALTVEIPRTASHGDWSTNAAMILAKAQKKPPRELAEIIMNHVEDPEGYLAKTEIAGPGFINFTLSDKWWHHVLGEISRLGDGFGESDIGKGKKILIEFVSANPTGPLHVGHGRGAAFGDALARLLPKAGFQVSREYYINDAGNQMQTLGRSIWYRYLELFGREIDFAENLYKGEYIKSLAAEIKDKEGDRYLEMDEERAIAEIYPGAASRILGMIKDDLAFFQVKFDSWFSEKSLVDSGRVASTLKELQDAGHVYEDDGALWLKATSFGDEKDRPVVKSSGENTYIASDLAYHRDKYLRGFDQLIDIWGADHHGYIPRMRAGIEAMGFDQTKLEVILVQMVSLLRDGEPVAMSTRAGEFVTLQEVIEEVGADAARFFFLIRRSDSMLDFDLEVAKQQSSDNPVYYVQYVHARVSSVFKNAVAEGVDLSNLDDADLSLLSKNKEMAIIKLLASFPDVVESAAISFEPHRVTHYLTELAGLFHPYYNKYRFIGEDLKLTHARLFLVRCVQKVIANGLDILGINAPESM